MRIRLKPKNSRSVLLGLLILALACGSNTTPGLEGSYGFDTLAFVQRSHPGFSVGLLAPDLFLPGGRAVVLKPAAATGEIFDLSGLSEGDVIGLDVAPDGERIVFSARMAEFDSHHLLEMDLDLVLSGETCIKEDGDLGLACRQLTFGPADDTRPFYLADGRVGFVRSHPWGPVDFQGRGRARVLHAVEADGSRVSRLEYGPGHALGARPMRDGTVSLVRVTQTNGALRFVPLRIDPAGAEAHLIAGSDMPSSALALNAQIDDQGRVLAACIPSAGTFQAGTLCAQEADGNFVAALSGIAEGDGCSPDGRLRHPVPLGEERYLVSYAKTPNGCLTSEDEIRGLLPDFGLAVLDTALAARYPLFSDPDKDELFAKPVKEHALLDPGVTPPARPEGSCAEGGVLLQGLVTNPEIVAVRVLEGISGAEAPFSMELGGRSQGAYCTGQQGLEQLASVENVAAGRGYKLRVPSKVPLKAQMLDRYGATLSQDVLWWGAGSCAVRGAPEGLEALSTTELLDRPEHQRGFDFRRDIQPILNRSCVANGCHDAETAAGAYVDFSNRLRGLDMHDAASGRATVAYNNLMAVDRRRDSHTGVVLEQADIYVTPGSAKDSRLARRLGVPCRLGDCEAEDWAAWGVPAGSVHPMDQAAFDGLVTQGLLTAPSNEDRWLIVDWIDAGAAFYGRGATP